MDGPLIATVVTTDVITADIGKTNLSYLSASSGPGVWQDCGLYLQTKRCLALVNKQPM